MMLFFKSILRKGKIRNEKNTNFNFTLLLMIAITACKKDVKPDNNNDNEIVFSEFVAIENENCSIKIQEINLMIH